MQNRIDRLEGLVLSLMTNGAQSAGPTAAAAAISRSQSDSAASSFPTELDRDDDDMIKEEDEGDDSDVDGVTNSLGVLKVDADKGKSLYFGDSHWHLVLADVSISSRFYTFLQFLHFGPSRLYRGDVFTHGDVESLVALATVSAGIQNLGSYKTWRENLESTKCFIEPASFAWHIATWHVFCLRISPTDGFARLPRLRITFRPTRRRWKAITKGSKN